MKWSAQHLRPCNGNWKSSLHYQGVSTMRQVLCGNTYNGMETSAARNFPFNIQHSICVTVDYKGIVHITKNLRHRIRIVKQCVSHVLLNELIIIIIYNNYSATCISLPSRCTCKFCKFACDIKFVIVLWNLILYKYWYEWHCSMSNRPYYIKLW